MKKTRKILAISIGSVTLLLGGFLLLNNPSPAWADSPTANVHGYAWSDTIGWISMNCKENTDGGCSKSLYGVDIDPKSGSFSGHAWAETIGWISFEPSDVSGCPLAPCQGHVDLVTGTVTGWMRAVSVTKNTIDNKNGGWNGWIRLSDACTGTCPAPKHSSPAPSGTGGVTFVKTPTGGKLVGFGWGGTYNDLGSAVVGWVDFYPKFGGVTVILNNATSPIELTGVLPSGPQAISSNGYTVTASTSDSNIDLTWKSTNGVEYNSCVAVSSPDSIANWSGAVGSILSTNSVPFSATKSNVDLAIGVTEKYRVTCKSVSDGSSVASNFVTVIPPDPSSYPIDLVGVLQKSGGVADKTKSATMSDTSDKIVDLSWDTKRVTYLSCKGVSSPVANGFNNYTINPPRSGFKNGVDVPTMFDAPAYRYQVQCVSSSGNVNSNPITIYPPSVIGSVSVTGKSCVLNTGDPAWIKIDALGYNSCTISDKTNLNLGIVVLDSSGIGSTTVPVNAPQDSSSTITVRCIPLLGGSPASASVNIPVTASCKDTSAGPNSGGGIKFKEQ